MKRNVFLFATLGAMLVTSCNQKSNTPAATTTGNIKVIHETSFDSVYGNMTIESFKNLGFEFGDSVDVTFSTGSSFLDIPFYDGYYSEIGKPLVVGYPGYPYIDVALCNRGELWQKLNLTENDTMCITLNKKAKYLTQQETFSMHYSDNREDFLSDVVFSNFRTINLSTMNQNVFYRGASPVDNQHKRASCSDNLLKETGIGYVLDLADSKEEVESYMAKEDFNSPYALSLYQNEKIAYVDLGADFTASIFQEKLINGLENMIKHEAPYYIHCTEGKDRTGFVCFFLEALSGASYEELENDYMITYDNYFGITKDNNPSKYQAIVDLRFKDFIKFLAPNATTKTYKNDAIKYLADGGMSEEDINTLISIVTK